MCHSVSHPHLNPTTQTQTHTLTHTHTHAHTHTHTHTHTNTHTHTHTHTTDAYNETAKTYRPRTTALTHTLTEMAKLCARALRAVSFRGRAVHCTSSCLLISPKSAPGRASNTTCVGARNCCVCVQVHACMCVCSSTCVYVCVFVCVCAPGRASNTTCVHTRDCVSVCV